MGSNWPVRCSRLYCIDPYYGEHSEIARARRLFDIKRERFGSKITHIPEPSPGAASYFSDGSLDVVYIDGNHSYEAVKADIRAWLPKLSKPTGYIAGHDYNNPMTPGVRKAVDEQLGTPDKICIDWSWLIKIGTVA